MPADFECRSCKLRFATGNHYFDLWSQGYTGRTNAFCTACGAQHGVETARSDRGKPFDGICEVTAMTVTEASRGATRRYLQSLKGLSKPAAEAAVDRPPVLICTTHSNQAEAIRERLEALGASVQVRIVGQTANPYFGPIQPHRLRFLAAPEFDETVFPSRWLHAETDGFVLITAPDLPGLTCQHCGALGSLNDHFNEGSDPCPHCHKRDVSCVAAYLIR